LSTPTQPETFDFNDFQLLMRHLEGGERPNEEGENEVEEIVVNGRRLPSGFADPSASAGGNILTYMLSSREGVVASTTAEDEEGSIVATLYLDSSGYMGRDFHVPSMLFDASNARTAAEVPVLHWFFGFMDAVGDFLQLNPAADVVIVTGEQTYTTIRPGGVRDYLIENM
jgi:hypothetical protein